MSFNRKNTDRSSRKAIDSVSNELNKDDLDIKTHLNTSLDLKGITVSEELIKRTLEAVKQSDTVTSDFDNVSDNKEQINSDHQKDDKIISGKLIPWYKKIRIVAGTAAAVLVVVAGLNFYNNTSKKNMEQSNTGISLSDENSITTGSPKAPETKGYSVADSSNNAKADKAGTEKSKTSSDQKQKKEIIAQDSETGGSADTGEDTSADDISIFEDKSSEYDNGSGISAAVTPMITSATNQTGSKDSSNGSNTNAVGNNQDYADASVDKYVSSANQKTATMLNNLSFQKIVMTSPKIIQKITIKDQANQTTIVLSDQDSIENFYTIMDQQKFVEGSEPPSVINYTIVATSIETSRKIYKIQIGDSITVSNFDGNTVNTINYNAVNKTKLFSNLRTFCQQNSN